MEQFEGAILAAIAGVVFGLILTIDAYLSRSNRNAGFPEVDHATSEGHGIPGDEGQKGREQHGIPAGTP